MGKGISSSFGIWWHLWRKKGWWSVLGSASYIGEEPDSGSSPTRRMLSQIFFMNKLYLDRENRTVLWNHPCAMARIRSQSNLIEIGNVDNWMNPMLFSHSFRFRTITKTKRRPGSNVQEKWRGLDRPFDDLLTYFFYRISQFYLLSMGQRRDITQW